jgi:hypothetical protein
LSACCMSAWSRAGTPAPNATRRRAAPRARLSSRAAQVGCFRLGPVMICRSREHPTSACPGPIVPLARAPEVSWFPVRHCVPIVSSEIVARWVPGTRPGMTWVVGALPLTDRRWRTPRARSPRRAISIIAVDTVSVSARMAPNSTRAPRPTALERRPRA